MPVPGASLRPRPPPPPPPPLSLLPPQAASVEATVAAARTVTSRRDDLDNGSPLVRPGRRCPGVWSGWGGWRRRFELVALTPSFRRGPGRHDGRGRSSTAAG